MKKLALVSILVASTSMAFADFTIQPGQWDYEVKMKAMGMEMPAQQTAVCITKEMAESFSENISAQAANGVEGCDVKVLESTDEKIKVAVKCDAQGQKIDSVTNVDRKSDKEIIMTSNSTVEVAGQKQETEMTITQKWTSETCTAQ